MPRFLSKSPADTQRLGFQIGKKILRLKKRPVLFLYGDLGSGKTTFVKGLGRAFGVKKHIIKSPTFVMIHEYQGRKERLYHFDLYRVKHEKELMHDLNEILAKKDGFAIVEWADRMKRNLPKIRYDIFFEHHSPNVRKISLRNL